jgi:hypothetical protein
VKAYDALKKKGSVSLARAQAEFPAPGRSRPSSSSLSTSKPLLERPRNDNLQVPAFKPSACPTSSTIDRLKRSRSTLETEAGTALTEEQRRKLARREAAINAVNNRVQKPTSKVRSNFDVNIVSNNDAVRNNPETLAAVRNAKASEAELEKVFSNYVVISVLMSLPFRANIQMHYD